MAAEWYVEDDGRATGPFSVSQMRAQAAATKIKPDTRVRKGRRGKWIAAKQVQGLLPPTPTAADASTSFKATHAAEPATAKQLAKVTGIRDEDEGTFLAPLRNRRRRFIIFLVLVAFILIGRAPIHQQLAFDICMGLMLGSYPIVEVKKKTIEQTIMVFFLPAHEKIWKLRDFVGVEADVETRLTQSFGCLILIVFLFRIFDHLMPWLGGDYKLWLRRYDDERIQIWQGNNTADYEANLALLESTGLRIG